jgi:drug/metabolite transporter (DMT)-like permease
MQSNQSKPPASPVAIWAAMICVWVLWGSTFLSIRFAIETIPPHLMAGIRFLTAGAVLYVWRRLSGDARPVLIHWRSAAILGLFLLFGGNGAVVWAEQRVASGIAALLVGSAPLWMILIDAVLRRKHPEIKRPGWVTVLGVVLGFVGIVILAGPSQLIGLKSDVDLFGAVVLTASAFSWAAGSLYSRQAPLPESPLMGTAIEMLCGGTILMLFGTLTGQWSHFNLAAISARSLAGLAYLIIFGAIIGFGAYTWLLRVAPTSLVSTYAYVNPIIAILMGNLLAAEPLTPRVLIAAATIIGGVMLITLTQRVSSKTKLPDSMVLPETGSD